MDLETWEICVFLDVVMLLTTFTAFPLYPWHSMPYDILLGINVVLTAILAVLLVTLEDVMREAFILWFIHTLLLTLNIRLTRL